MAYTPTEWQSGDIVTSAKLNKIENGIASAGGGGVMYVTITDEVVEGETVYSADKTVDEIITAVNSGKDVRAIFAGVYCYLLDCVEDSGIKTTEFSSTTAILDEGSTTTAILTSIFISMNNEGSGDVIDVQQFTGEITLANTNTEG